MLWFGPSQMRRIRSAIAGAALLAVPAISAGADQDPAAALLAKEGISGSNVKVKTVSAPREPAAAPHSRAARDKAGPVSSRRQRRADLIQSEGDQFRFAQVPAGPSGIDGTSHGEMTFLGDPFSAKKRPGSRPGSSGLISFRQIDSLDASEQPRTGEDTGTIEFDVARRLDTKSPGAESVSAAAMSGSGAPDLAQALSNESLSLQVQRRSPIAQQPYISGFKNGQIYSQLDGAYYVAARQDLDSMLSKIDFGTVQDVIVINGPYSVQYGPGFSFLDIVSLPTPRNQGPEFTTNGRYIHNGRQWYGRETVAAGGQDFGYRLSAGSLNGSDYVSGDGTLIPSSYQNRDVIADLSFDLNPHQRLDLSYRRVDQNNTEIPGQFFDVNYLGTDAYTVRLTDEDPTAPWTRLTIGGWYNRTLFNGDTLNASKRPPIFDVINRVEDAIARDDDTPQVNNQPAYGLIDFRGFTDGDLTSTGGSTAMTFGDPRDANLTLGADIRHLDQQINENFLISSNVVNIPDDAERIFTNQPRSTLTDPGLFGELSMPMDSYWTTRLGTRVDWVHTEAAVDEVFFNSGNLEQNDVLFASYLTNEYELTQEWKANLNFGHAQRPPSLTERYADQVYIAVAQSGFTRFIGDPDLDKERNWQIDVGLQADYANWRASARAFNAWVVDYITYEVSPVPDPTGARRLSTINTGYATLTGFELASYYDLNRWLTPFGEMRFVYGVDQTIDQPLSSIPPLDTRLGLQFHDRCRERWGVETFARVVSDQDRAALVRQSGGGLQAIEEGTDGFTTAHIRAFWNVRRNLQIVTGIDNVFDANYLEHLSLRLPENTTDPNRVIGRTEVLSPGFTPYFSLNWTF